MSVHVHIVDGPLEPARSHEHTGDGSTGALLRFDGVVRALENGRPIAALTYDIYEPMACKMLLRIGEDLVMRHGLLRLEVWHSRGRVRVGEVSFRLVIESPHRKESLAAMDAFIDMLKCDVPIWKVAE